MNELKDFYSLTESIFIREKIMTQMFCRIGMHRSHIF